MSGILSNCLVGVTLHTCSQTAVAVVLTGGVNPFGATQDQVAASNNQSDFYVEAWQQDQDRIYQQYLNDFDCGNSTLTDDIVCREDAFNRSINEATGSEFCSVNTGGTKTWCDETFLSLRLHAKVCRNGS
jgi:uncharacterized protein YycO